MKVADISLRVLDTRDPDLPLPEYETAGAAGLDICASLPVESRATGQVVVPGERVLVPSGLAVAIPPGFEIQMRPRSGLALKYGLTLLNSPGTIDSDYRGEIGIILINHGPEKFIVTHGMRIAQMVVAEVCRARFINVQELDETGRGAGGFGSTGTR